MADRSTGMGSTPEHLDGFGAVVAGVTAVTGLVALGIAVTTLPRSGPFCAKDCLAYPYADAAAFVPRDFLWMYPATVMLLSFLIMTIVVHAHAPSGRRVAVQVAVAFTLMAATTLVVDYAIQLTVVQPSLLAGESDGVALVSQYNPHGVFIALENVGYASLGVAFVFLSRAFSHRGWLERSLRWLLIAGGALTVSALVVMSWWFGLDLEYRFEVVAISITWIAVIVSAVLSAAWFRRRAEA
jgi:hypothetical protein